MSRIALFHGRRSLYFGDSFKEAKVKRAQCRAIALQAEQGNALPAAADETLQNPNSTEENCSLDLDISDPTYMIWGANTGVGKTLVSAGLAASILSNGKSQFKGHSTPSDVLYIKPVQTGYPSDSDSRFVTNQVSNILKSRRQQENPSAFHIRNQYLNGSSTVQRAVNELPFRKDEVGMKYLGICSEEILEGSNRPDSSKNCHDKMKNDGHDKTLNAGADHVISPSYLTCTTMWSWFEPVSPHLAAEKEKATVDDSSVLGTLTTTLQSFVKTNRDCKGVRGKWSIIETAGGVASPGPSGTLQCDLYRPLRLPGVLVADGRLGGISTTISALDALRVRGCDIAAVILLDSGLGNHLPIMKYLQGRVPVMALSPVPSDPAEELANWFAQSEGVFSHLRHSLEELHIQRIQRLQEMAEKAKQFLWWPFTQHTMVPTSGVTVIDSSLRKLEICSCNSMMVVQVGGLKDLMRICSHCLREK